VYEIERNMFDQSERAALKVITIPQSSNDIEELRSNGYDDESITNTFKSYLKDIVDEYSLMRKLNGSANVVNCDDVRYVQHDDGLGWDIFIKMELVTPLTKALGKSVSEEQVIQIGTDICKALILCKKHNIIHRDIKPANIFVSENGDYKLGDFGIAKTVEKTSGGTKIGTYEYMAPEVYHDEPYGSSADLYSLGLVLYWLLNERRTPFLPLPPKLPTNSDKDYARKKRFGGAAIHAPAHGSEWLKQVVLKACAYRPEDRYSSASELLAALNKTNSSNIAPPVAEIESDISVISEPITTDDGTSTVSVFSQIKPSKSGDNGKIPDHSFANIKIWIVLGVIAVVCIIIIVLAISSVGKVPDERVTPSPEILPSPSPTAVTTSIPTAEPVTTPILTPKPSPTPTATPTPNLQDIPHLSIKNATYPADEILQHGIWDLCGEISTDKGVIAYVRGQIVDKNNNVVQECTFYPYSPTFNLTGTVNAGLIFGSLNTGYYRYILSAIAENNSYTAGEVILIDHAFSIVPQT